MSGHWREEKSNVSRKIIFYVLLSGIPCFTWFILMSGWSQDVLGRSCSTTQSILILITWDIYVARVIYSLYGLLPRSSPWNEVLTVSFFLYIIAGTNILSALYYSSEWKENWIIDGMGMILYLFGSFLTTWSEQTRAW